MHEKPRAQNIRARGTLRRMALPISSKFAIEGRVNLWKRWRKEFAHTFALNPVGGDLTRDDIALLETIAHGIVRREMAAPALLFLESLGPLSFLGSQALHGLTPFLELVSDERELERLAVILERRDTIDRLITLIQEQSSTLA